MNIFNMAPQPFFIHHHPASRAGTETVGFFQMRVHHYGRFQNPADLAFNIKMPCFYMLVQNLALEQFGAFRTGLFIVRIEKMSRKPMIQIKTAALRALNHTMNQHVSF